MNAPRKSLPADTLVAYLDETGDERLADPGHSVFGIGGCCFLAGHVQSVHDGWVAAIPTIWRKTKAVPHAKDSRMRGWQIDKLAAYFRAATFTRIASMVDRGTHVDEAHWDSLYHLAFENAINVLQMTMGHLRASGLLLILEKSERCDPLATKILQNTRFHGIPWLRYQFASKGAKLPGLQIADYVIREAGRFVRSGNDSGLMRAMFEALPGGPLHQWARLDMARVVRVEPTPDGRIPEEITVVIPGNPKRAKA